MGTIEKNKPNIDSEFFLKKARDIRKLVLDLIYQTKSPHVGPSFSIVEILVALYYKVMNVNPANPSDPNRDRFILSKGHSCATLYAVLGDRGFLKKSDLDGFAVNNGVLEHHPWRNTSKGIDVSTGSLGHGLSIGAGMALGAKIDRETWRVFVVVGDGELNEGSIWEAILFAGHHKLNNLVALVDSNKMQALGFTKDILNLEPMKEKFQCFGWHVQSVDGHDFNAIFQAMSSLSASAPNMIILNTIKGKGVSFMEGQLLWHYRSPDGKEYQLALEEISK